MLILIFPLSESYASSRDATETKITTCNCVAFRLDDIQDYYLNRAQVKVIQTFEERNASLTIGVIANYFGDDAELLSFLWERIGSESFALDVANHGMNHEDFSLLAKEVQSDLLAAANGQIKDALGVQPSVFIAPFNRMNGDTLLAAAENNLHIVSTSLETEVPFVMNVTSPAGVTALYHFPRTAQTGDISSNGTEWIGSGHRQTLLEIEESVSRYGYAVVMMHPQEFSVRDGINFQNVVDADQLAELELLLDSVRQEGYDIVTVLELARHATVPDFAGYAIPAAAASVVVLWMLGKSTRLREHLPL